MSTPFVDTWRHGKRANRIAKFIIRRIVLPFGVFAPLAFLFPKTALLYAICGLYDVGRNQDLSFATLRRYFTGNGFFTWVTSPINIVLDILSLPYINKGVYRLEDLPPGHRDEIVRLIQAAKDEDLVRRLEERAKENQRTMIFFKWYGVNVDTFLDLPSFHQPWKYVQTIGVSVFNRKVSTSKHFGFMRASLRVLYNLNDSIDDSAYIVVGRTTNSWRNEKLFIFDDTLMHEPINQTDRTRYCLFVDILRPSPFPFIMRGVVTIIRLLSSSFKFVYYKNWKVIQ
mgnify:CR=1 FL=1